MKLYKNTSWDKTRLNEKNINIPKGWSKSNFLEQSVSQSHKPKEGLRYLEIGDIDIRTKEYSLDGKEKTKASAMKYVPSNTLLISTVRPTRLSFTVTKEDVNASSAFVKITSEIQDYLIFNLYTNAYLEYLSLNQNGATYPTIKENVLLKFEFALPSENEMMAISSLLLSQTSIINKIKNIISSFENLNNFMMHSLLSGSIRVREGNGKIILYKNPKDNWISVKMNAGDINIPKDWGVTVLKGEINSFIIGTAFNTSEMQTSGKYPVIKMTDIKDGKIEKGFKVFTDVFKERSLLKYGDLVVGLSGSVGKIGEVLTKNEILLNQRCLGLRSNRFQTYIRSILEYDFKNWAKSSMKDGVIPNISHLDVLDYNIPKLTEKEKQLIDEILKKSLSRKRKYEQLLKKEEDIFEFLLEELLSGRLRVKV